LSQQIRALSENFKASSSEAWTTWTLGIGASLTIWAGAYPLEADEPTATFAKLGAIFYLPIEPNLREIRQKIRLDLDLAGED